MSEGYFTGIFKIVLACEMCGEKETEGRVREKERGSFSGDDEIQACVS